MRTIAVSPGSSSSPTRWATVGAAAAGAVGALAGLILGLVSYPPTAWFAVVELGLPAAVAGGLLGLLAGAIATAVRRIRSGEPDPASR